MDDSNNLDDSYYHIFILDKYRYSKPMGICTGIVDIGKWKDVPIVGNLNNGNTLFLNVDPVKTDHHFKGLPIYGTVASLIDQSGKELRSN